jgi:hypothetical protein
MRAGGHLHERAIDAHRGAHGEGCVEEAARRVRCAHQAKHRGSALPHAHTDACTIHSMRERTRTHMRMHARAENAHVAAVAVAAVARRRRYIWTRLDSPTHLLSRRMPHGLQHDTRHATKSLALR